MNQIGLHIGYWWGTGEENDVFRMLDLTHQAELDIMELNPAWLLNLSPAQRKDLLQKAKDYGMTLTLNGGLDATNDISCDGAAIREKGVQYCKEVLELMPELEMKVWSGINYSAWLRRPLPEGNFLGEKSEPRHSALNPCKKSCLQQRLLVWIIASKSATAMSNSYSTLLRKL